MYAIPFDAIGSDQGMTLYEILGADPMGAGWVGGTSTANADCIMFWYNDDYRALFLSSAGMTTGANPRKNRWINPGSVPDSSWGTANMATQLKLKGGTAFWVKRAIPVGKTAANLPERTIQVAGQVITKQGDEKVAEYVITPGTGTDSKYTLCAAGFTAPFIPNPDLVDSTQTKRDWIKEGAVGGTSTANADCLMLWYNGDYRSLFLSSAGQTSGANPRKGYWINPGSVPDSSWGTANMASRVQIQPTQGFWYFRTKTGTAPFTLRLTQPYSL